MKRVDNYTNDLFFSNTSCFIFTVALCAILYIAILDYNDYNNTKEPRKKDKTLWKSTFALMIVGGLCVSSYMLYTKKYRR